MGITSTPAATLVSQPAARIVGSHGYRIDGDTAYLNADIEWTRSGVGPSSDWALRLWAHPARPESGKTPVLVAELPLHPAASAGWAPARVEGWGRATPPAGSDAYTMVLQLSTWSGNGDAVHDQVAFLHDERFVQPRLENGRYRLEADRLVLEAGRIANPRTADNLSGSLVLELWALEADYRGGAFAGLCIGAAMLGRLDGQQAWFDLSVSTAARSMPAGARSLSLMLREWTAAGYVTRDYVNLDLPTAVETQETHETHDAPEAEAELVATPVAVEEAAKRAADEMFGIAPGAAKAVVAEAVVAEAVAAKPVKAKLVAARAPVAKPAIAKPAAAATPAEARPVATAAAPAKPIAPGARPEAATREASNAKQPKAAGTSINEASEDELAAVKGMPKAIVKAIVAKRPFLSLDGLLELKGMGPKLLDKLRRSLSL